MTAVELALRHIEKLMARGKRAVPKKRRARKQARVVSAPRRHISPEPYNPRSAQPDVAELVEAFAPTPTPPEVQGSISPALYVPPVELTANERATLAMYERQKSEWVDGRVTERPRGPGPIVDADLRPNVNFSGLTSLRGGGVCPSSRRHPPRWGTPRRLEGASK